MTRDGADPRRDQYLAEIDDRIRRWGETATDAQIDEALVRLWLALSPEKREQFDLDAVLAQGDILSGLEDDLA